MNARRNYRGSNRSRGLKGFLWNKYGHANVSKNRSNGVPRHIISNLHTTSNTRTSLCRSRVQSSVIGSDKCGYGDHFRSMKTGSPGSRMSGTGKRSRYPNANIHTSCISNRANY